jgi:hypothetical protein
MVGALPAGADREHPAVLDAAYTGSRKRGAARSRGSRHRETPDWAYGYIVDKFWDKEFGGIYWMLDYHRNPISDRKQIYAHAFAIYGMAEFFRAAGSRKAWNG